MNGVRGIAMIWFGCCLMSYGGIQADLYSSNQVPESPEPFPAIYQNYQILPGTVSPNQQYALIYPKRSLLYDLQDYGLFLVANRFAFFLNFHWETATSPKTLGAVFRPIGQRIPRRLS